MTAGAKDKKKIVLLAALGLVLAWVVYSNLFSGPDIPAASNRPRERATADSPIIPTPGGSGGVTPASTRTRIRTGDSGFHPVLHPKDPKNRPDPNSIDPTLRRDRLEAVQAVELAGGARNLFQFGTAPVAKAELPKGPEPVVQPFVGPKPPPPPPPTPAKAADPPPPPIPLKFYAFWVGKDNGKRTACFLDNDDIVMAAEGETLKRRYRVVRINPTSVVMEDTEVKKQQTLPLAEEAAPQGE
jgi:hypothetical protein